MEKSTLTQQTVTHGPNHEHLSRKQERQLLNKVGDLTTNADDVMNEYDEVENRKKMHSRQRSRWKKALGGKNSLHPATQATKIHLHYPQLLKSSIQATSMSHHQFQG
jgi:hypothetical protein